MMTRVDHVNASLPPYGRPRAEAEQEIINRHNKPAAPAGVAASAESFLQT